MHSIPPSAALPAWKAHFDEGYMDERVAFWKDDCSMQEDFLDAFKHYHLHTIPSSAITKPSVAPGNRDELFFDFLARGGCHPLDLLDMWKQYEKLHDLSAPAILVTILMSSDPNIATIVTDRTTNWSAYRKRLEYQANIILKSQLELFQRAHMVLANLDQATMEKRAQIFAAHVIALTMALYAVDEMAEVRDENRVDNDNEGGSEFEGFPDDRYASNKGVATAEVTNKGLSEHRIQSESPTPARFSSRASSATLC